MFDFPKELPIDKGRLLYLEPSISLLCFSHEVSIDELSVPLRQLGLAVIESPANASHVRGDRINNTPNRIWVRVLRQPVFTRQLYEAIRDAFGPDLRWIGPAYQLRQPGRDLIVCPLPHVLIVRFMASPTPLPDVATALLGQTGTPGPQLREVVERSAYLNGNHYYEIGNPMEWDAYSARDLLLRQFGDRLAAVFFDKMLMYSPLAFIPNDTYYASQWNLAKISASPAWDFSTGSSSVVIAIIDTGSDLTHLDGTDGIKWAEVIWEGGEFEGGCRETGWTEQQPAESEINK